MKFCFTSDIHIVYIAHVCERESVRMCVCAYVFIVVYVSTRARQTCYVSALQQIMSIFEKIDKLENMWAIR